ncbi:MAG: hypothetical protein U0805_15255 [Pirellulales bacterium]
MRSSNLAVVTLVITVSRPFDVPAKKVFAAWLDAKAIGNPLFARFILLPVESACAASEN